MAIGLLKPGVSLAQASHEVKAISAHLAQQYPDSNEDRSMLSMRLLDSAGDDVTRRFVLMLTGATLFVLLLACANVGNLQLARAASRQREIAIRAALGAGRLQIARQMMLESIVISLVAGALGLLLASWNMAFTRGDISANILRIVPGLASMRVDSTVVALTLAASLVAGMLCSLPAVIQLAVRGMRRDLNNALQQRGDTQSAIPAQNRMRSGLVVLELALALVLLVGAGMMVKTFRRLIDVYQGFDPKNLLTMQVTLPPSSYEQPAQQRLFYDRALEGLGTVPGIKAAAISSDTGISERLAIEARPEPRPGEPRPEVRSVSAHYFEAMRIPIFNGRSISENDRSETQKVVVVSESIARHYWPKEDPIGRRLKLSAHSEWLTVVGVCGDVIEDWFTGESAPAAYVPYTQAPAATATILLRTPGDPVLAAPTARARIRVVDRNLPIYNLQTMEQARAEGRGGVRASARAMTTYAIIALILAVTGIYGVLSYFVTARTHDIGIRIALGANRADILGMTMRRAAALTAIGLAIGLPLAILLARVTSAVLYGVVRVDTLSMMLVTGVLIAAALIASYLPSWRATQIDPVTALRRE